MPAALPRIQHTEVELLDGMVQPFLVCLTRFASKGNHPRSSVRWLQSSWGVKITRNKKLRSPRDPSNGGLETGPYLFTILDAVRVDGGFMPNKLVESEDMNAGLVINANL